MKKGYRIKMSYDEIVNNLECIIKRYKDATHHVSCIVDINILKNALNTIEKQESEIEKLNKLVQQQKPWLRGEQDVL